MTWISTKFHNWFELNFECLCTASLSQSRCESVQRMKLVPLVAAFWLAMLVSVPVHADEPTPSSKMECDIGPIVKTYGGTDWLVYSCNDRRSVVIVAAKDSPARPFLFRFLAQGNAYVLQSRGTGDRKFTFAAFNELKAMSGQDIEMLVTLTRASAEQ